MVAQVKAFDSDSFLFQGFITTAMRMSSGAMFTPHNPVGQHSPGSYIFTFFRVSNFKSNMSLFNLKFEIKN